MTHAEILSVGDEVVAGQVTDSNAAWLARRLTQHGIPVVAHAAARDVEAEIAEAVTRAAGRSDVVIVTGGLGPTPDDRTRRAVAAAAGADLVLDPPSLEHIRELFARRGVEMPRSNERQADVPEGADVLPNGLGTAAGFRVAVGRADVFVLPGVPEEMKAMFDAAVLPLLPQTRNAIATRVLRCFGMSESLIAETLAAEMDLDGTPQVAFLASQGTISVKFTASADTPDAALERIEPARARARALLGDAVFGEGEDTLEQVVARLLASRGATLAVAESCTGGLVANWLTDVPGISEHFLEGLVAYSNASKTARLGVPEELFATVGAVSEEVARAMAAGVRERSGADLGVGITGLAGPSGGRAEKPVGTVHVAVAAASGVVHRELRLRGRRVQVKNRAAKHALNLVRLELERRDD